MSPLLSLLANINFILMLFSLFPISFLLASHEEAVSIFQWKISSGNINNSILTSWNIVNNTSSSNPCTWFGVSCNMETNHVIGINLTNSSLKGTLVDFPFFSLPNLEYFDLSLNQLSGPIPKGLRNLSLLTHLGLGSNQFVGEINEQLGYLTRLRVLDLSYNNLSGLIPASIGNMSEMTYLDLSKNQFAGSIPKELENLKMLWSLDLRFNTLSGQIGSWLGNLTNLRVLSLGNNGLLGSIPSQLGYLKNLVVLQLFSNQLSGSIPSSLGNLTNLTDLYLQQNGLSGFIPPQLAYLKRLNRLELSGNQLTGLIPTSFENMTSLKLLDLSENQLIGPIPENIGNLNDLQFLYLQDNRLNGTIPVSFDNLTNLESLLISNNSLSGSIMQRFGNHDKLFMLEMSRNNLTGQLPQELCRSNKLETVAFDRNRLTGTIPESLRNCTSLLTSWFGINQLTGNISEIFDDGIYPNAGIIDVNENLFYGEILSNWGKRKSLISLKLSKNNITGKIPPELGELSNLGQLDLSSNHLSGNIPKEIGQLKSLEYLNLRDNDLEGTLPEEFGSFPQLLQLDLSSNLLNGFLPKIGISQQLVYLNLSNNIFTQEIPVDFGNFIQLNQLDLGHNRLTGEIPSFLSNLQNLELLDLSHNNLSGRIPRGIIGMPSLSDFDVSFNDLDGPVPDGRSYMNLTLKQLEGNPKLCGGNITGLQPCREPNSKKNSQKYVYIIVLSLFASLILAYVAISILKKKKDIVDGEDSISMSNMVNFFSISTFDGKEMYKKILEATEDFNEAYSIGEGGFGTVYKAQLSSTHVVAVKKLHTRPQMRDQRNDFLNEIRALTMIRHRNIVKLHGYCSGDPHSFLIYDYLERGSLDNILKEDESAFELDWRKRVEIINGIANALSYMHHDCVPPIVHRDISSKNILLNHRLEAFVSDFGTAKFLKNDSSVLNSVGVVGTFGYMAPELAYGVRATEKCDVFSFGVLTLEIIKGEYPVRNSPIVAGASLAASSVNEQLEEMIDKRISHPVPSIEKILASIIDLALECLNENPLSRPTMRFVSSKLQSMVTRNSMTESPSLKYEEIDKAISENKVYPHHTDTSPEFPSSGERPTYFFIH